MSLLLGIFVGADGAPNLAVIVPVVLVTMVLGGVVVAVIRSRFGPPEPIGADQWAHAAYSIWTGGEDCGQWDRARARDSLRNWYGVTDPAGLWETIRGLQHGRTGSLAWDHVRAIDLLRIGTAAGYIGEDECWHAVCPMADTLREHFDSWSALASDFEAGMQKWQEGRGITSPDQRGRVQRNLPYLRQTAWPMAPFAAPLEV
ncbi:MAG: DUF1266 domain-containing protein [Deltaproteobacteria bacterium]|nr:DUF1266 domain-containing protein [Deltaproteobacteria bacterium]